MADEYIRKADAIGAIWHSIDGELFGELESYAHAVIGDADNAIESLEPADVVQVVRCRNCKHHTYDEIFSSFWCEYPGRVRDTTPDGFCEKGEE